MAASAELLAVLQGEAAGSGMAADVAGGGRSEGSPMVPNGRHVLQFSNGLRAAHSPVPAPPATVNQAESYMSGRRRLAGAGPGAAGAAETTYVATGRKLAGAGPGAAGAAETTQLATGRRLAGEEDTWPHSVVRPGMAC